MPIALTKSDRSSGLFFNKKITSKGSFLEPVSFSIKMMLKSFIGVALVAGVSSATHDDCAAVTAIAALYKDRCQEVLNSCAELGNSTAGFAGDLHSEFCKSLVRCGEFGPTGVFSGCVTTGPPPAIIDENSELAAVIIDAMLVTTAHDSPECGTYKVYDGMLVRTGDPKNATGCTSL